MSQNTTNLGSGSVKHLLFKLAIPAVVAQLINLLYNIVDRIYIGHIPEIGTSALTGVGLCMPILMLVNKHQSYLELKNYRQFNTVEWVNPVEANVIMAELEALQVKLEQTRTRNIEAIDNKMNFAPQEDGKVNDKKSLITQKMFDEKVQLYGLTNNEKVITVLLLHGFEYREIASKTKASMDKVLAITDSIYRKTGTSSKIELIDLFLRNT
jgi:DNA-binding CsgD family transcriptional regulator